MADGTTLNPGTGGDVIATDDIAGTKYQIVKLATGALDTATLALSGSGTATGAIRVELPTNGTGVVGLNAGTNAIGKLSANSGVDIGDVDVTTVGTITPGTAATSLGKAEDAAHASSDVGIMSLAVRSNTAASTSGTDGDYQPLITNTTGHLWVDASGQTLTVASHAVTNAGTFAVQATEADGANTTLGAKADAKSTATDTTAISAMSVLKQISASVQAPPSQAVTNTGTFAVQSAATLSAETTKVIGTVRTADGAGNLLTTNSTTYTAKFGLDGNLLGTLGTAFSTAGKVDVKGADGDVFVRQATATNLKAQVVAGDATGAAVPANAFYQAGIAQTSLPTAATAGNLTGAMVDKFGRQVALNHGIRDIISSQTTTISASTSETTIVTAAASIFNDIFALVVSNTSATAARVDFRDTTAGSILFSLYIPAGDVRGVSFSSPIPQTTVNTNWTAQSSASVTDLRIAAWFVKNK